MLRVNPSSSTKTLGIFKITLVLSEQLFTEVWHVVETNNSKTTCILLWRPSWKLQALLSGWRKEMGIRGTSGSIMKKKAFCWRRVKVTPTTRPMAKLCLDPREKGLLADMTCPQAFPQEGAPLTHIQAGRLKTRSMMSPTLPSWATKLQHCSKDI